MCVADLIGLHNRCRWDVCVVPDDSVYGVTSGAMVHVSGGTTVELTFTTPLPSLPQVHLRLEEHVTLTENNKVDWSITKASAKE